MLVVLFAVASLALMAGARGFARLALTVSVSGLAAAATNPVTNRLIATHLPRGQQGTIVGVKQPGVQLAAFISGAALPTSALGDACK